MEHSCPIPLPVILMGRVGSRMGGTSSSGGWGQEVRIKDSFLGRDCLNPALRVGQAWVGAEEGTQSPVTRPLRPAPHPGHHHPAFPPAPGIRSDRPDQAAAVGLQQLQHRARGAVWGLVPGHGAAQRDREVRPGLGPGTSRPGCPRSRLPRACGLGYGRLRPGLVDGRGTRVWLLVAHSCRSVL